MTPRCDRLKASVAACKRVSINISLNHSSGPYFLESPSVEADVECGVQKPQTSGTWLEIDAVSQFQGGLDPQCKGTSVTI